MLLSVLIIVAAVIGSALISASEAAIISVNRFRVRHRALQKRSAAICPSRFLRWANVDTNHLPDCTMDLRQVWVSFVRQFLD